MYLILIANKTNKQTKKLNIGPVLTVSTKESSDQIIRPFAMALVSHSTCLHDITAVTPMLVSVPTISY
jgi:hypothetical protein